MTLHLQQSCDQFLMWTGKWYSEHTWQSVLEYTMNTKDNIIPYNLKAYRPVGTKITSGSSNIFDNLTKISGDCKLRWNISGYRDKDS